MSVLFKRCGWIASIFGVLSLVNGQWAVLQVIAWTSMLLSYSAESGLELGFSQTFDGNHPCQLCTVVDEGVKNSNSDEHIVTSPPVDRFLAVHECDVFFTPNDSDLLLFLRHSEDPILTFRPSPPTPPPRQRLG